MNYKNKIMEYFAALTEKERAALIAKIAVAKGLSISTIYKYSKGDGNKVDISEKLIDFFEGK